MRVEIRGAWRVPWLKRRGAGGKDPENTAGTETLTDILSHAAPGENRLGLAHCQGPHCWPRLGIEATSFDTQISHIIVECLNGCGNESIDLRNACKASHQ